LDSLEKSFACARMIYDKKGKNLEILELKNISPLSDYFIVCSGTSDRHVKALANHIEISMKEKGSFPLGIEGLREGKWVLMDYDDIIIHIFQEDDRGFYDLENLWLDCPRIPFTDEGE